MGAYTDTSSRLARDSETCNAIIRLYARLGLLDYVVASNGVKLFRQGQAALVRQIKQERLARRFGRRHIEAA
jgi:hypothetical protein